MREDDYTILLVPGYGDSGPNHWQGIWLDRFPSAQKVIQKDWVHVKQDEWVTNLDTAIRKTSKPIILVGHSLGCLTILYRLKMKKNRQSISKIQGALLVAPPDPESPPYRALTIEGFDSFPSEKIPFPSILVISTNDPFLSVAKGHYFATCLGSQLITVRNKGHLGEESGLREWEQGKDLLSFLCTSPCWKE